MSIKQTLCFPEQEKMISYLEQHPKLSPAFFRDKGIIQKVVNIFARTEIDFSGLDLGIDFCLRDLKSIKTSSLKPKESEILQVTKDQIKKALIEALKDCSEQSS